jgi:integrase
MSKRHQDGYIFRKGAAWYLRYYEVDTTGARVQRCRKLVDYGDRYRSKSDVRTLAVEFLRPLNEGKFSPQSTLSVAKFIDDCYFPAVKDRLRPSTLKGYKDFSKRYVHDRVTKIQLRDFRCADGERLLSDIGSQNDLTRTTLYHIKSFVSGVFKFAKRQGVLDGPNPIQDVSIPAAKAPGDTHAYALEQIQKMMADLPELAKTVVAAAAFTGLRKSELRGLRWEDYRDGALYVSRSIWGRHVLEPKTPHSRAAVPVVAPLADLLDRLRASRTSGPIFRDTNEGPLNLDNLARRVIQPVLVVNKLQWHGWHAFRRGLATNLHRLGVDDKTIQTILRHSSVQTTREIYIKGVSADAAAAMERLELAIQSQSPKPN